MLDDPVQRFYTVIGTAIPVVRNMLSIALRPALLDGIQGGVQVTLKGVNTGMSCSSPCETFLYIPYNTCILVGMPDPEVHYLAAKCVKPPKYLRGEGSF